MDQEKIGEIGMLKIKRTGITPIEAARSIVRTKWDRIDEESKKDLVVAGIASLLNGLLQQERAKEFKADFPIELSPEKIIPEGSTEKEEVNRIHQEIHCPFSSHKHKYASMYSCVSSFLYLSEDEREKRIIEQRESNDRHIEGIRKDHEERDEKWVACMENLIDFEAEERAIKLLKSITLQAQDGSMQTLLDFGLDDLDKWERNSRAKSRGWKIREKWFRKTRSLLEQHGVCRIGDLPSDVMTDVAEGARKIWKKERVKVDA